MRDKEKNSGITLIALVVTIIVLLLLAGISLSMLTGPNGLLSKATKAGKESIIAEQKEKIIMAYNDALTSKMGGEVTAEDIRKALNNNGVSASVKDTGTITVTIDGNTYTINQNGEISEPTPVTPVGEMTLVEMYNQAVADHCENLDGLCADETHLHIGDYVDYQNPTTGSVTISPSESGMDSQSEFAELEETGQTFEITAEKNQLNWRVLGLNEEENAVELIAGSPIKSNNIIESEESPYLYMCGAIAYVNGENILNKISAMYKNEFAEEARSANKRNIDRVLGIATTERIREINLDAYYGFKNYGDSYSYDNQYTPEMYINGAEAGTITGTIDGYIYSVNSPVEEEVPYVETNTRIYNMLFDNTSCLSGRYWLLASSETIDEIR